MQLKGDMEAQLCALYRERERLFQALGTADADQIMELISSLEEQLVSLYRERASAWTVVPAALKRTALEEG